MRKTAPEIAVCSLSQWRLSEGVLVIHSTGWTIFNHALESASQFISWWCSPKLWTGAFHQLTRDDFKPSQEQSHSALTQGTFYAQILMLRLMEMLFWLSGSVQDYVTYSFFSPSVPCTAKSVLTTQQNCSFAGRESKCRTNECLKRFLPCLKSLSSNSVV